MSKRNTEDYLEYIHGLDPDDAELIIKFYNEFYRADFYRDAENIIKDDSLKKEAIRNSNARQRDLMSRGLRDDAQEKEQFMEDASDEWEWRNAYKLGGYELASQLLIHQTIRDLDNMNLDLNIVLVRFYIKMRKLDKLNRKGSK